MANPTNVQGTGGHSVAEKTRETGSTFADKAKQAGSTAVDKTKEAASTVGDMVSGAASSVGTATEKLATNTGAGIRHLGETIREKGPQEGMLGGATRAVADTFQTSGRYLEQEGLSGMVDDVTSLIRRNPLPAILVGIGVGFLIGRTLGSS